MKEYAVGSIWGIRCYSVGNTKRVEVVMRTVPWHEIVDEWWGEDKDEANRVFKEFVKKYKGL